MGEIASDEMYPSHLVPVAGMKILIDIDDSHYLGRWAIPTTGDTIFDANDKIKAEYIQTREFPRFSTNKLPPSKETDLLIQFNEDTKDKYQELWMEGNECAVPRNEEFILNNDRQIYYLKIGTFNNFSDKYTINDIVFKFRIEVVHKPIVANYWHFQFAIYKDDGSVLDKFESKGWHKSIRNSIFQLVLNYAKRTIPKEESK